MISGIVINYSLYSTCIQLYSIYASFMVYYIAVIDQPLSIRVSLKNIKLEEIDESRSQRS